MPLRAFLLFGLLLRPCWRMKALWSFNALAGIFAFRTKLIIPPMLEKFRWFQCPCGHFCFSDKYLEIHDKDFRVKVFQCPCGHFCFSDYNCGRRNHARNFLFQCPCGHFCFSDYSSVGAFPRQYRRFQCPCGHFCFSDMIAVSHASGAVIGFNALAGIFAFRTHHSGRSRRS